MKRTLSTLVVLALASSVAYAQRGRGGGPNVGDEAPNFKAKIIGEDEFVELKDIVKTKKKPVVLIFGSYT